MILFCRKIIINKPEVLKAKGPLLLACNHPNSFLDSIILDALFEKPVWSLARGDAFKTKPIIRILSSLNILPVYRTSEGPENLAANYKTFDSCIDIFRKDGIVTIFSEGKCINEWHLRPLKKGTARLAMKAWEENLSADRQGIPLQVIPVGINYSSYHRFGKNIFINFGEIISKEQFDMNAPDGVRYQEFNNRLRQQLHQLVFEIPKDDKNKQKEVLEIESPSFKKILLFIPAVIGFLVHAPLFVLIKKLVWERTAHNDHYDSVMTVILLFTYPLYLLLITYILWLATNLWQVIFLLLILPFTAWSYVQLKAQLDK